MAIWNADGSEAEMCGNGIRCVCKFAHDRGLCRKRPMRIQTRRGVLALDYALDQAGLVDRVTVDMGEPILEAAKVPVRLRDLDRVIDAPVPMSTFIGTNEDGGHDGRLTCVSMGNPHAIFYCKDVEDVELELLALMLQRNPMFPNGTNIHVVQVLDAASVKVRTAERGAGLTLACGTGGAAVCVAGALTGRTARRIRAHMPGGDLDLDWSERTNRVSMTGPAVLVFTGEWPD
jgi:diaminopimelate epimerase